MGADCVKARTVRPRRLLGRKLPEAQTAQRRELPNGVGAEVAPIPIPTPIPIHTPIPIPQSGN